MNGPILNNNLAIWSHWRLWAARVGSHACARFHAPVGADRVEALRLPARERARTLLSLEVENSFEITSESEKCEIFFSHSPRQWSFFPKEEVFYLVAIEPFVTVTIYLPSCYWTFCDCYYLSTKLLLNLLWLLLSIYQVVCINVLRQSWNLPLIGRWATLLFSMVIRCM